MNRLQSELHRLYLPNELAADSAPGLIDAQGRVRAAVLELARPADWAALSTVWRGVQAELGLPAPAIAVNGIDGYQLWFSLAEPVPAAEALVFLEALRRRYLSGVVMARVGMLPTPTRQPRMVPALQAHGGNWSAFVAPDLAPVFAETPWLDTEPGAEGQADLLARLASIKSAELQRALQTLGAGTMPAGGQPVSAGPGLDPKRFLLEVMNDGSVAMSLRIEAAKALLPWFEGPPRE